MRVQEPTIYIYYNAHGGNPPPAGNQGGNQGWDPSDIDFQPAKDPQRLNEELSLVLQIILSLLKGPQEPGGQSSSGSGSGSCSNPDSFHAPPTSNFAANPNGSNFNAGPNEKLQQWGGAISNASEISGIDPNVIGGQVWAESRGDPNTSTTNADGTNDKGLMQISQERWERDILPNLSDEQKQKIRQATGKDASQLDMSNPEHNVIGGSLELRQWIDKNGGDLREGLRFYVSGGDPNIGDSNKYINDVLGFAETLRSGGQLPP